MRIIINSMELNMKILILLLTFLVFGNLSYAQSVSSKIKVIAESNVVMAGTFYSAKISLVNIPYTEVSYLVLGNVLSKDKDGAGLIKFMTAASIYDVNDESKQTLEVEVVYTENGQVKRAKTEISYTVKKP
jgi:hypothetical protein